MTLAIAGPSERPHRAELDFWMTHPDDVDFIEDPAKRWCRVCLRHPEHSIHSKERRDRGF